MAPKTIEAPATSSVTSQNPPSPPPTRPPVRPRSLTLGVFTICFAGLSWPAVLC